MIPRTHYEVRSMCGRFIFASLTLYGDSDEETNKLLLGMVRESLAVAAMVNGCEQVTISRSRVDLPTSGS